MRKRIFRSTAILVTLAILVTFVTAFFFMYNKLEENMTERVDNEVDYLAKAVDELGGTSLETGLADGVTGRITVVDAVGNVLYDSYEDAAEMENHASRPEIAQAMKEGRGSASRYSTTYAKRSYYAAVRLDNGQILRVGDTIDSVYGTLFPGVFMLLLPLVLLLILSFYLIDRTTKRMMEPLEAIDLDHPLENVAYDELVPFLRRIAEQNEALKEQVQERNKQQQEYVAITENMKDGLIVTNRHHVLSINRAAQRIFEIKPEECMGQNIIVVNRNQKLKEVVDGALAGKDMVKHMTIDDVTYELHGNPVIQDGTNTGVVIFIMDVTQKKQLENMRQEFSANVSHELKTPLMSISGYAELLKDGIVRPEDQKEFAGRIYQEAARLTTLVQDIIRLSKLDDENLELEKSIVLIDLAVPRDIEPEVGRFEGVTLYDMDSFKTDEKPAELQEHLEAAGKIVREQMDEFFKWLEGKNLIPRIQEIKENAVNDFNLRIMKPLKNTHMEEQEKEQLLSAVDRAMEKVVNKMLFGLRDSMNEQAFLECVAGLEKTYEK